MVARDDSVIRGSLITCLILLVLSLALNFFFWRSSNVASQEAADAKQRLTTTNNTVREMQAKTERLQAMLGFGSFTEAELEAMKQSQSEDPDMAAIEEQFATHMSMFGADIVPTERNYKNLPEFLVNALRDRNNQYATQVQAVESIQNSTKSQIDAALASQAAAEKSRDEASQGMKKLAQDHEEFRKKMISEMEQAVDLSRKATQDLRALQVKAREEKLALTNENRQKLATIDTQKIELNRLRSTNFETTQGKIIYAYRGGRMATINLGSADKLVPGITFGVIDAKDKRLQEAKVKATVQVTQVTGPYLSTVRVIARPKIENPIIPGDKIYSPFWSPGRVVRIALVGDIDLDGDKRPDNEAIKGQIRAAGAEVAAEVSMTSAGDDDLDASVRFMVIGEDPEVSRSPDASDEEQVRALKQIGRIKARAAELGITIIPVDKLLNYLRTIDDTLTTPLGSAARAEDFEPETNLRTSRQGIPSRVAEIYKKQTEGVQEDNKILPP